MTAPRLSKTQNLLLLIAVLGILSACQPSRETPVPPIKPESPGDLRPAICSFNIQFLGLSRVRNNRALAETLRNNDCSLVFIQEIVAPPDFKALPGNLFYQSESSPVFPNSGNPFRPSAQVTDFFQQMIAQGYDGYWLSEQDSGMSETNENNGSATEWWAVFYRSSEWSEARDLPYGFLAEDVTANPEFDRVPFAFSFRHRTGKFDFVGINVHLRPGASADSKTRRNVELTGISQWIEKHKQKNVEKDYFVIGDFNIEDSKELENHLTISTLNQNWQSLNETAFLMTNTNVNGPKPYDHVFYFPELTAEIIGQEKLQIINLIQEMKPFWSLDRPYPGDPYDHNLFRTHFSDHHPIKFQFKIEKDQD